MKKALFQKGCTIESNSSYCFGEGLLPMMLAYEEDNIGFYDCTNDLGALFEVLLDNCGSFRTNCEVSKITTSTKSEKTSSSMPGFSS